MQEGESNMTLKSKFKLIAEGVLLPFAIFWGITFIITLFYIVITANLKPNLIMLQGISNIFCIIVLFPLYAWFLKKYSISEPKFEVKNCFYLIAISFAICIVGNILVDFIPKGEENKVTKEVMEMIEKYNVYVSILFVAVLIPIVEELIFRGFFYETIKMIANDKFAIIITSIIFAIAHWDLRQGIYAFFAGIFLGYIKYKYRKLVYTIWMHLLMNFASVVFVQHLPVDDIKEKLFIMFIGIAILFFSMYRINMKNEMEIGG